MALSVVEFQDPTGEIMVARNPPEGTAEFVLGSQLVVQDGQVAVFYRDGRPTDGFKAGRYTLDTQNLPVLSKVLKLATFGRRSPFRAYVYFIQLKTFTALGWGTPTPIMFRDSEFKAVHLRAHGTFSLRVAQPAVFLRTMVGSQGLETTYSVQEFVRRIIVSRFANFLPTVLKSVLDLSAHYREIEIGLKKAAYDDLTQYGLELADLFVEAITVPPEVQQMIDRAAGSRALEESEVGRYQRMAVADALRDGSKQPGGAAGMAGVVGLGAGIGMARELAGSGAQTPPSDGPPPLPPPLPTTAQWYAAVGQRQTGPLGQQALASLIESGQVKPDTLVWRQGMADWTPAARTPEVAALFGGVPPPLPRKP